MNTSALPDSFFRSLPIKSVCEVSSQALVARINRKLAHEHRRLCKSRPRARQDLGEYYLLDTYANTILDHHLTPAELAVELGVLGPLERLAE